MQAAITEMLLTCFLPHYTALNLRTCLFSASIDSYVYAGECQMLMHLPVLFVARRAPRPCFYDRSGLGSALVCVALQSAKGGTNMYTMVLALGSLASAQIYARGHMRAQAWIRRLQLTAPDNVVARTPDKQNKTARARDREVEDFLRSARRHPRSLSLSAAGIPHSSHQLVSSTIHIRYGPLFAGIFQYSLYSSLALPWSRRGP
jgi:hypothetical protein